MPRAWADALSVLLEAAGWCIQKLPSASGALIQCEFGKCDARRIRASLCSVDRLGLTGAHQGLAPVFCATSSIWAGVSLRDALVVPLATSVDSGECARRTSESS